MMLECVTRKPEQGAAHLNRPIAEFADLLAWTPIVAALSRGEHVALASVDRALYRAVTAKRWHGEDDAAACSRLMRQDQDVRVLLKARGEMTGREIELPQFDPIEIIPVTALAPGKGETDPFVLEARTALRVYINESRLTKRELVSDVKRRLAAANDPEFRRLNQEYEATRGYPIR